MNPNILNYLQAQSASEQNKDPYNPFDSGISRAIASARASLGMSREQQERALRESINSFATNISQQPQERGFGRNLAAIGRALTPSISTYDQYEDLANKENNELANQIIKDRREQEALDIHRDDREWNRAFRERELGETAAAREWERGFREKELEDLKEYRKGQLENQKLLTNFRTQNETGKKSHGKGKDSSGNLGEVLKFSQDRINALGNKGKRNILENFVNHKFLSEGTEIPLNPDQMEIDTIGKYLKGKLFREFGYQNEKEFKEVPTITVNNSPATNQRALETLEELMLRNNIIPDPVLPGGKGKSSGVVSFYDPATDKFFDVPSELADQVASENPDFVRKE